jgi:hypothetical protein
VELSQCGQKNLRRQQSVATRKEDTLRFLHDPTVPFTNNQADPFTNNQAEGETVLAHTAAGLPHLLEVEARTVGK